MDTPVRGGVGPVASACFSNARGIRIRVCEREYTVALERQTIEKRDFPIGRRGYDPDAVDAHLRAIADEIEHTEHSSSGANEPIASVISEQVRAIVEAAERGASEIQGRAETETKNAHAEATRAAKRERQQATRDAKRTREEAAAQAREFLEGVSKATAQMLERLEAMESELGAVTDAVRSGAQRLSGELQALESELEHVGAGTTVLDSEDERGGAADDRATAVPAPAETIATPVTATPEPVAAPEPPASEPAPDEPLVPLAEVATEPAKVGDPPPESELEPLPREGGEEEPVQSGELGRTDEAGLAASASASSSQQEESADSEGARLVALNMALNGTPRDETDRFLADNFTIQNRESLLDEVYASL